MIFKTSSLIPGIPDSDFVEMSVGGGEGLERRVAGFQEEGGLACPALVGAVGMDAGDRAVVEVADALDIRAIEESVTLVVGRECFRFLIITVNVRARGDPKRVGVSVNGSEIV